jgi:hypothetical protein
MNKVMSDQEKTGNAISGSGNGRRNWITNWFK